MVLTFEAFECGATLIGAVDFWELLQINFASDHWSMQLRMNKRAAERE
jgi:hypothetical protein